MQTELISREENRLVGLLGLKNLTAWKKNYNHFFFCPRWKISSFLLLPRKKWKWKIKSVSSWLECCARMCRHLCFVLFLSVCVCIYIYIEFLSSFVFFLWYWIFGQFSIWATRWFTSPLMFTRSSWTHRHRPLIIPASNLTFWPLRGYVALPLWKSISQRFNRRDGTLCLWLGCESQKCDFFLWFFHLIK